MYVFGYVFYVVVYLFQVVVYLYEYQGFGDVVGVFEYVGDEFVLNLFVEFVYFVVYLGGVFGVGYVVVGE